MLKFALLFSLVAWNSIGSLSGLQSVCLLEDPINQCGNFCMTSLAPMLNHIRQHQDAWAANDHLIKKTEERLNRIEGLLTALKYLRQKGPEDTWPQDFKARLDRLETQQGDLLKKLDKFDRKIVPPKFELIGSRFFYIEGETRKNWSAAANTCRQMGAQLAVIRNEEEWKALKAKLPRNLIYWLDLNDLETEGEFKSSATGKLAPFFKWRAGQPNNSNGSQHCVDILDGLMYDNKCESLSYFICQSDDGSLN
ncbi:CD209 antigen-like protein E [Drosophila subpulchrella]|uniref:CD209 antigen-like protein E n=1 Tax=Drosophila subpulchrella TaxID=1486046 RepID=UPI0018A1410C|nr:CD209 antigen-like protein E [Drosophila subpulchrella]